MKPQPKTLPISETTIGVGKDAKIRGVTELYLPSSFAEIKCEVDIIKYDLKNLQQLRIITEFKLTGSQNALDSLYQEEEWKLMTRDYFFEQCPETLEEIKRPLPIFAIMLPKHLRVESATLKVNGKGRLVAYDQTTDIIILPDSFPPLAEMPEDALYSFYNKKTTSFYADIELDNTYSLEIDLESCGSFETVPFFPYGKVEIKKAECSDEGDLIIETLVNKVSPTRDASFPDWLQYKHNKLTSRETLPPLSRPAFPFRGEEVLFNPMEGHPLPTTIEEMEKMPAELLMGSDDIKDFKLEKYNTLRFAMGIIIPPDKDFEIIVRTIKRPLPTRIYKQMERLPNYQDVLVEYDITNFSKKKMRLRVETEIVGFSDKVTKTIFVHKTGTGHKARNKAIQCPRLKRDILETIVNPTRATIICKVTDEDNHRVIYEETFDLDLLPHDEMIWKLKDVRNDHQYNLTPFICAWVYPTDRKGLLDRARARAIEYHPKKCFDPEECETLAGIENYARAVYDYLNQEVKIRYLNQPFSSKPTDNSQRVILPEKVLENAAGNCIDLTVMFASILEGLGIYSLIFLTQSHAFIGWGNPKKTSEMIFLETTFLGRYSFDEAKAKGEENFRKDFLLSGSKDPISIGFLSFMEKCHIIDLKEVRKSGIISRH